MIMKYGIVLLAWLAIQPAHAAVDYSFGPFRLYRNGNLTSPTYSSYEGCVAGAKSKAIAAGRTVPFECRQAITAKWVANPVPVNCVVSAWSAWAATDEWSACSAGTQTRAEQRTRTITTQPANGGTACPALSETRTVTQSCTVEPP